jgi:dTDP-4-dehydrorhamnose reductase
MNKILLLGSKGQLGRSFCEILEEKKINFKEYDFPEFDIIDKIKVKSIISSENPDVIINCTGYTDVAKAEIQNNVAMQINGTSLMYLVELCNKSNIFLCHFSTDYVFDGNSKDAYKETDNPNPKTFTVSQNTLVKILLQIIVTNLLSLEQLHYLAKIHLAQIQISLKNLLSLEIKILNFRQL